MPVDNELRLISVAGQSPEGPGSGSAPSKPQQSVVTQVRFSELEVGGRWGRQVQVQVGGQTLHPKPASSKP